MNAIYVIIIADALIVLGVTIAWRHTKMDTEAAIRDAVATGARTGAINVTAYGATLPRYAGALSQQTLRQAQKRSARSARGWRTRRQKFDMRPIAWNITPLGTLANGKDHA